MAVSGVGSSGNGYYLNGQPRTGNADTGNGTYLNGVARNNKQKRASTAGARDVRAYMSSLSGGLLDQSAMVGVYNGRGGFDTATFDAMGSALASNLFDTASSAPLVPRAGLGRFFNRIA